MSVDLQLVVLVSPLGLVVAVLHPLGSSVYPGLASDQHTQLPIGMCVAWLLVLMVSVGAVAV